MAGITIQKNYVSSSLASTTLANNWTVLVLGITDRGPVVPTLVQTYSTFTKLFGQPVKNTPTHAYMNLLLNSGVPVLFKRVLDTDIKVFKNASVEVENLFTVKATDIYSGAAGNDISVTINKNTTTGACNLTVSYKENVVKTYPLGIATASTTLGDLLFAFLSGDIEENDYVTFTMTNTEADDWKNAFVIDKKDYALIDGATPDNTLESAITILSKADSKIWSADRKLKNAAVYYPQLRFITSGGIISDDIETQNKINHNMGLFATACGTSFRVLVDYSLEDTSTATPRNFANEEITDGSVSPAVYAYFGFWGWGADSWLPGSAGFLSALGLSGYNVYSRRIAGSSFNPAFSKAYEEVFIDALNDWQAEDQIQINPIVIVDAQDNLAVMGSSTLAAPIGSSRRNPSQALDIVLVGDYVANLLNNIALGELESALDRLSINSLSSKMSQEVEKFVTSRAITRYDFTFDTTQLGKLGINCTLYFAVGLEEVELTVTSVYDTTAIAQ